MKPTRHTHLEINAVPNASVPLIDFSVCVTDAHMCVRVCVCVYVRVADRVNAGWRGGEGELGAEINHLTSGRRVYLRLWDRMRRSGALLRTDARGVSRLPRRRVVTQLRGIRSLFRTGPSCIQVTAATKDLRHPSSSSAGESSPSSPQLRSNFPHFRLPTMAERL